MENSGKECIIGARHEEQIKELVKCYDVVAKDVKEIKEKLLARPSWAVSIIIAFLSTLAFSALTFAFTIIREYTIR